VNQKRKRKRIRRVSDRMFLKRILKNNNLAPCGTDGQLYNWRFCQVQSHVTKLGQISIIWPNQIYTLCPTLRIRGQLPAPIVNGGGDSFWKWKDFQLSRARDLDLDLGSGHTAYRHAITDLYPHAKFHWNWRNVLRTDVRTYGRTFQTHFIRSTQKSRRKNYMRNPPVKLQPYGV